MPDANHPLLIHLHIPKNAGTTFSRLIKLRLATYPPAHWFHHSTTLGCYTVRGPVDARFDAIDRLSVANKQRVRFFESHAAFGVHERLPKPSAYFTLLRDPVARTLSMYDFMLQDNKRPQKMTLEHFCSDKWFWPMFAIDNAQVRYLAGKQGELPATPFGQVTREMLETAKQRLSEHFLLVGTLEQFDESVVLLRRALAWKPLYYARSNITKNRTERAAIPDPTMDRIREINELDLELLEFARALMQQRIDAEGESFQSELADYKRANASRARRLAPLFKALPACRAAAQRLRLIR